MKTSLKTKLLATSIMMVAGAFANQAQAAAAKPLLTGGNSNVVLSTVNNTFLATQPNVTSVTNANYSAGVAASQFSGAVNYLGTNANGSVVNASIYSGQNTSGGYSTLINQNGASLTASQINFNKLSTNANDKIVIDATGGMKDLTVLNVEPGSVSNLQGSLIANDHVVIQNSAGVIFSGSSKVNVGALGIATAAATGVGSYGDAFYYNFSRFNQDANVTLDGSINTGVNGLTGKSIAGGGYLFAFADNINVNQTAKINTNGGAATLRSGSDVYYVNVNSMLNSNAASVLNGTVVYGVHFNSVATPAAHITIAAGGMIKTQGGNVSIVTSANTSHNMLANSTINMDGVIDSSSLTGKGGNVRIASNGQVATSASTVINTSGSAVKSADVGGTINITSAKNGYKPTGYETFTTAGYKGKDAKVLVNGAAVAE